MARVVVVGGGFAGTATAARLAKLGHDVTLLETLGRLGGAVGFVEQDGFRWDSGPTSTALPAVLRDLFRKSGRPLERELDLVPQEPMREHRFVDGSSVAMPSGSRSAQQEAVDAGLGAGLGQQWVDYTHEFADAWDLLRRGYLERPYLPEQVDPGVRSLLTSRLTLQKLVAKAFKDERLRQVALHHVVLDGHDPRNVPAWVGMLSYVEQNFGMWTVPGGVGELATVMTKRLEERDVQVLLSTTARDIVVQQGRAVAVSTDDGQLDADVVVCAVDPRRIPLLAPLVEKTMPAIPPVVCHLGIVGDVPELPPELVLHGEPTVVVRTNGTAPDGAHAWTLLGRGGGLSEDLEYALARHRIRVREQVEVRVDRSPRELVELWSGSPYGVLWQGRATVAQRLSTSTPYAGVYCAGASVAAMSGLPFAGLTAAVVAEQVGPA
jgi:phytoene dehydrogenase-like protein